MASTELKITFEQGGFTHSVTLDEDATRTSVENACRLLMDSIGYDFSDEEFDAMYEARRNMIKNKEIK